MPLLSHWPALRKQNGRSGRYSQTPNGWPTDACLALPLCPSQPYTELACYVDLKDGSRVMETKLATTSSTTMSAEVSSDENNGCPSAEILPEVRLPQVLHVLAPIVSLKLSGSAAPTARRAPDDLLPRPRLSFVWCCCAQICYEMCTDAGAGYTHFGLQYSYECWCSTTLSDTETSEGAVCDYPCTNTPGETCGGYDAIMAYEIN